MLFLSIPDELILFKKRHHSSGDIAEKVRDFDISSYDVNYINMETNSELFCNTLKGIMSKISTS